MHFNLDAWFRHKALLGLGRGRIGRGRGTRPSGFTDAFFIVLAGGKSEAKVSVRCLAGMAQANLAAAAVDADHDEAAAEVHDYMVHSRFL